MAKPHAFPHEVFFPKKKKQIKNKKKPSLLLKLKYRPKEKK